MHNTVNQALTTAHAKVAVLSSGPAYKGYSLTTSQVANIKDLEIIRGAVAPLLPTGLQYWVGLPTSTLFVKIVDVPYYSNLVNKVKTTIAEVKAAIAASPLTENFKYTAEPRIVRNSDASTTAKVYINIWDSQAGTRARGIIDKPLLFGTRSCYVRAATANAGAPLCQRCWRWATQSEGAKHPSCAAATAPALTSRNPIVMRADFARATSKPNRLSPQLLRTSPALTQHAALTAENIIQQRTASVRSGATAMTPSGSMQNMPRYVCIELTVGPSLTTET